MRDGVRVAVLAIQGDFALHLRAVADLGVEAVEARTAADIASATHLVLPGGESTTMLRLLERDGLEPAIREHHARGRPILATCAGAILIARQVTGPVQRSLGLVDLAIERNAYGRQLASFIEPVACPALGPEPLEAVFIRAPIIREAGPGVTVLARRQTPVLVRQDHVLVATFHPELGHDRRLHRMFVEAAVPVAAGADRV